MATHEPGRLLRLVGGTTVAAEPAASVTVGYAVAGVDGVAKRLSAGVTWYRSTSADVNADGAVLVLTLDGEGAPRIAARAQGNAVEVHVPCAAAVRALSRALELLSAHDGVEREGLVVLRAGLVSTPDDYDRALAAVRAAEAPADVKVPDPDGHEAHAFWFRPFDGTAVFGVRFRYHPGAVAAVKDALQMERAALRTQKPVGGYVETFAKAWYVAERAAIGGVVRALNSVGFAVIWCDRGGVFPAPPCALDRDGRLVP